ncbi:MAG: hypothetical protein R3F11_20330 [Verrucomicrobiales bacterium]
MNVTLNSWLWFTPTTAGAPPMEKCGEFSVMLSIWICADPVFSIRNVCVTDPPVTSTSPKPVPFASVAAALPSATGSHGGRRDRAPGEIEVGGPGRLARHVEGENIVGTR